MKVDFVIDHNEELINIFCEYQKKLIQIHYEDDSPECELGAMDMIKVIKMAYEAGKANEELVIDDIIVNIDEE